MDPETTSQENYDVVGEISPSNNYLDIHDDHTHADRHHIDRDANDIDRDDNQHASTVAALSALPKEVVRSETDERKKKKKEKKSASDRIELEDKSADFAHVYGNKVELPVDEEKEQEELYENWIRT